ncbi:MAG: hypothetical protein J6R22_03525 [Alphaproteobacteria bacterium]|nr:hypothetical protein [Alphaproteobacteria bacterium]
MIEKTKPNKGYTILQGDFDILKKAVQSDPAASLALSRAYAGNFNEVLTDDKMKQLFGANYEGLIYFDYEANEWNRYSWGLLTIDFQYIHTKHMQDLKEALRWTGAWRNVDLLAAVAMGVDAKYYKGQGQYVENPVWSDDCPKHMVGNLVCRDHKSGRILPVSKKWIGIEEFEEWYDLSQIGISRFAFNAQEHEWFRERAAALIQRQK